MLNNRRLSASSRFFTVLALVLVFPFSAIAATELEEDIALVNRTSKIFVNIVEKAKPAVVHIQTEKSSKQLSTERPIEELFENPMFEQFFGPYFKQFKMPRNRIQKGQGSGFIISRDGLILTNNHVVDHADSITVTLADKRVFDAKIVGTDPQTDVALLKIDDPADLPVLPLGDSSKLLPGEWVIAIGNPFGLSQTVTAGVVSATGRDSIGINEYENFIQTDAAINPGNSGGPLLNGRGEAIGINTALFSRTGGYMGIGFAIPINMAKSIEKQLQEHGKVTRGWLGVMIQDLTPDLATSFGLKKAEGILISEVQDDSPAARAGIRAGDVVTHLNSVPLDDVSALRNQVAMLQPYNNAKLTLLRDGKEMVVTVTIGAKPGGDYRDSRGFYTPGQDVIIEKYGLTLQKIPEKNSKDYLSEKGVLISAITPGSPAERAGLKVGQLVESINRFEIRNLRDLDKILPNIRRSDKLLLHVRDGIYSSFVVLSAKK